MAIIEAAKKINEASKKAGPVNKDGGIGYKPGNGGSGPEAYDKKNGQYVEGPEIFNENNKYISSGDVKRDARIIQELYDKNGVEMPSPTFNDVEKNFDDNIMTPYMKEKVMPLYKEILNENPLINITNIELNNYKYTDQVFGIDYILRNENGFDLYVDTKSKVGKIEDEQYPPKKLEFSLFKEFRSFRKMSDEEKKKISEKNRKITGYGNFINTNKVNDFYLITYPDSQGKTKDEMETSDDIIGSNNINVNVNNLKSYLLTSAFKEEKLNGKSLEEYLQQEADKVYELHKNDKLNKPATYLVGDNEIFQIEVKRVGKGGTLNVNLTVDYEKLKKQTQNILFEFNEGSKKAKELAEVNTEDGVLKKQSI